MNILDDFVRINPIIARWKKSEWLFYFLIIPVILCFIYLFPDTIKQTLILNLKQPTPLSIFANQYTHVNLDHLTSNLFGYILSVGLIFNIETDKLRFHLVTVFFLLCFPIITSLVMIIFFPFNVVILGFSGIVSAFTGYIVYATYAYLRKRYEYIRTSFVVIPLLVNLTILCINNNYNILIILISSLFLIIFILIEGKTILNLIKDLANEPKMIPKNAWLEFFYKVIMVVYAIMLVFFLPSLIPANIGAGNLFVNTPLHLMGWMFGLFLPWLKASFTSTKSG